MVRKSTDEQERSRQAEVEAPPTPALRGSAPASALPTSPGSPSAAVPRGGRAVPPIVRRMWRRGRSARATVETWVRQRAGWREPDDALAAESAVFWQDRATQQQLHWQGSGIFAEEQRWRSLGAEHLQLYDRGVRALDRDTTLERIVEWGSGGGANAVHFAPRATEYVGVDVSSESLEECARQVAGLAGPAFRPVLISPLAPEAALAGLDASCDLFLSTYVFEILPSAEYGLRILRIAHAMLREGGVALVQIRYTSGSWRTASRPWGYSRNLTLNARYRIEDFWLEAERIGFRPLMVTLLPYQPLNTGRDYAYYFLVKDTPAPPPPAE